MPQPRLPDSLADVTLAILAGGEGSRMGMAKAMLTVRGGPILEYLLDEIAWPGPTMLVTAPGRQRPPGWRRFGLEVTDPVAGTGPLRGVLTALENLATPTLLILTVDMPGVRKPQCQSLLDNLNTSPQMLGVMIRRLVDGQPQVEPFPCAMRADARRIVERRLNENRRSIHGLLDEPGFELIDAPPVWQKGVWVNLNTPGDLKTFCDERS